MGLLIKQSDKECVYYSKVDRIDIKEEYMYVEVDGKIDVYGPADITNIERFISYVNDPNCKCIICEIREDKNFLD